MAKYARLRERVGAELPEVSLHEAPAAIDGQLLLAHESGCLRRVVAGALSAAEQRAIGFPWSVGMIERSRRSAGATLAACGAAADDGVAVNLAGGTHHARGDRGQGHCVFNDVAIAALARCGDQPSARIAIVDLDAVTKAGGYGHDVETTVQVHLNTVRAAARHWARRRETATQEAGIG